MFKTAITEMFGIRHPGPAWVSWRYNDGYCGWAPLPPAACYSAGVGFTYYGSSVGVSFGFGLGYSCYTFVPWNRFCNYRPSTYHAPRHQAKDIYHNSTVINNVINGNNNTIINNGTLISNTVGQTFTINIDNFTNNGTLGATAGTLAVSPANFTNGATGIISVGGGAVTIAPTNATAPNWSNAGLIDVTSGNLNLGGSFTATSLTATTNYTRTGGTVDYCVPMSPFGHTELVSLVNLLQPQRKHH